MKNELDHRTRVRIEALNAAIALIAAYKLPAVDDDRNGGKPAVLVIAGTMENWLLEVAPKPKGRAKS